MGSNLPGNVSVGGDDLTPKPENDVKAPEKCLFLVQTWVQKWPYE